MVSRDVEVAVAIEVAYGQAPSDFWQIESTANFHRHVAKFSATGIQKQLRRLGVTYVAANIPDRFVDVPVADRHVEQSVEISVEEHATEAQCVPGSGPRPVCMAMSS